VGYSLGVEQEPTDGNLLVNVGGLKLMVGATGAPLIDKAQIDYMDGLMRIGSVISNPNLMPPRCRPFEGRASYSLGLTSWISKSPRMA